jgi:hypothetical protein
MRRTVAIPPKPVALSVDLYILFTFLVVSLVLAACGSSSSSPSQNVAPSGSQTLFTEMPTQSTVQAPSGGSLDACALLPSGELTKIVGTGALANAVPAVGWMAGQCALNTAHSSLLLSVGTADTMKRVSDPTNPDARSRLQSYKTEAGPSARVVTGIGDGAVRSSTGIASYKGGVYLELVIMQPGLTDDQLVKVMKLAVAEVQG